MNSNCRHVTPANAAKNFHHDVVVNCMHYILLSERRLKKHFFVFDLIWFWKFINAILQIFHLKSRNIIYTALC